jgi:hypothetical protein
MEVFFKLGQVRQMMQNCQRNAVLRGETSWAVPVERYLGFEAYDVDVHNYCRGEYGLWFRLNDGRVIDWQGQNSMRDRALYDQPVN